MHKAQGRRDDGQRTTQTEAVRSETGAAAPRVWVRPTVAERSACAEIGAYAYQA